MYKCNTEAIGVLPLKSKNITRSQCVSVALVIHHAKRMPRFTLPLVACPALPYLSTLSHKRQGFR
jgi:hypothetical protein